MAGLSALLEYAKSAERVSPQQKPWKALWEMVRAASDSKDGTRVPAPLVGEAWMTTSALMKRHRLKVHLERAHNDGVLEEVSQFIHHLTDGDWAYERDFAQSPPSQLASNGPPRTDEQARTVSISIQIVKGQLLEFGGAALPTLTDCIGDLIVPAFAVASPVDRERLTKEELVELFQRDTVLRCRLSARHIPEDRLPSCQFHKVPHAHIHSAFVEIVLDEALNLRKRGSKSPRLNDARCHVPALRNAAYESLNEAYRRISEVFEPTRRSAGGNVFLNVYHFDEGRSSWRPLGELRGDWIFQPT
jgi:hypothetical protein